LYITGKSPLSETAIHNLFRICEEELKGDYELEVIDILEQPELAEEARIFATPAVIRRLPLPLRHVVGDLSDKQKVLIGLDLRTDAP
jgi:circadian clock protein KaiB